MNKKMRIGAFAATCGVSSHTVRYYEKIGLFAPSSVTRAGYREYEEGKVTEFRRLLLLRDMGFSLSEISDMIAGAGNIPCSVPKEFFKKRKEDAFAALQRAREMYNLINEVCDTCGECACSFDNCPAMSEKWEI